MSGNLFLARTFEKHTVAHTKKRIELHFTRKIKSFNVFIISKKSEDFRDKFVKSTSTLILIIYTISA